MSYLDGLNLQQREAVSWDNGSLLVLAGAGSGKTKVLTSRLAWLIETKRCHPYQVLAVTFTNKAAKEMVKRVSDTLPGNTLVSRMWLGTFHGICLRFLRQYYHEAGLTSTFQILDSADQISLIKRILKEEGKDPVLYPPVQVANFINHSKQRAQRYSDISNDNFFYQKISFIYDRYEQICASEMLVDFSELILRSYEVLMNCADLRQQVIDKFSFILIDEFQDTNLLQYRWLKAIAGHGTNNCRSVFAVGDDDQSIYSFRGATVDNIHAFQQDFNVSKVIRLEQNYRSVSYILDASNKLIANNSHRLGKNLWTDNCKNGVITVCRALNDYYEAVWLTETINRIVGRGGSLSDIAVLYRTNAQSRCIEQALFSANIPFRVVGGARFFDRAEVKHVMAYLRLVINESDSMSFLRIVNVPLRGIGPQTVSDIQARSIQSNKSLLAVTENYSGAKCKPVQFFYQLMKRLIEASSTMSLLDYVSFVIEETALLSSFPASEQDDRRENLDQFLLSLESFEKEYILERDSEDDPRAVLAAFLSSVALETSVSDDGTDKVSLMTIHMSKGLEFDSVFIVGLEQGLFPSDRWDKDEEKSLEEERRLMYVAMTRAKRELFFSFCRERRMYSRSEPAICYPSQFIEEIPGLNIIDYPYGKSSRTDGVSLKRFSRGGVQAPSSRSRSCAYHVGQMVNHQHFGRGCITAVEGCSDDVYVRVSFEQHGSKLLSAKLSKLEVTN
ncbi:MULTISPECIES: ATP-dependent helicase [Candidatus Ichthyocystis]|uniref:DNA 3'-5' helicase n=1 Tax=Candidatus Ichthyocystis hellenicum TaxID=1561003 RepID=A0A0S4M4C6_9BURK|nr:MULTISPECIES: UvrD-helicase domain-containing protein [Ichthyocystis]CUT17158.1 DNA helicase II [Candidatus Ichthyocystis hellenicum]